MKKYFALFLALCLVVGLVGCGSRKRHRPEVSALGIHTRKEQVIYHDHIVCSFPEQLVIHSACEEVSAEAPDESAFLFRRVKKAALEYFSMITWVRENFS